jgi:hypothetical protein
LVYTAEHLYSVCELYRILSVIRWIGKGGRLNKQELLRIRSRERQIPVDLRPMWESATAAGVLATTGAEPILGLLCRTKFYEVASPSCSKDHHLSKPQVVIDMGPIDEAVLIRTELKEKRVAAAP